MSTPHSDAIELFMTRDPVCIDAAHPIAGAYQRMLSIGCRHLPLISGGMLVGVISLRGLYRLAESRDKLTLATRSVFDAVEEPFVVVLGTPVSEVAAQMSASGFEAAIIVDRGQVIGIFTEADAVRALASLGSSVRAPADTVV